MKQLYIVVMILGLVGCATTDKLTKPKGNWVAVNPIGFIPPDTEIYKRPIKQADMAESDMASNVATSPVPTQNFSPTDSPSNLLQDKK